MSLLHTNHLSGNDKYQVFVTAVLHLSMARTIEEVGDIVRGAARRLTGAQGATFVLKENDLCYYADEDSIAPLWKGKRFPMETCISGWVMINKVPAAIPDIYQDHRIPHDTYRPTFVKSLVMVPIRKENPLGAIGNYWSTNMIADPETLDVLQALADITAVSIENINVYKELERRVQERTTQLEKANEQLQKANSELQTITYALSHDLKAPLRNIQFSLEKMMNHLGDRADDETRKHRDKVTSKVSNAYGLIDELLTLFHTGNKELELEQVDMKQLVAEVSADYNEGTPIVIDDIPSIPGDRVLLRHVWSNIISNAVKYSSLKPSPQVKIGAQELEALVVYSVEDNGVGFEMDKSKDLFKPFTRLHSGREYEGAGIGLSIVWRIVLRHGGKVWARSEVDKGTTIYFALPR